MKQIKTRIKSVESTRQITKAMELVATSKLRRAKERVEKARPYHEVLADAISSLQAGFAESTTVYATQREVKRPAMWSSPATGVWPAATMPISSAWSRP